MSIPFTQFMLPDGHRKRVEIDRPEHIEAIAHDLISQGVRFECEMLRTGEVSFEALDSDDNSLAMEVCGNGPQVLEAVDRLVSEATARLKEPKPCPK